MTKGEKYIELGSNWMISYEYNDYIIDFRAYKVISADLSGCDKKFNGDNNYYESLSGQPLIEEIKGCVKWDGCINIHSPYYHFCGKGDIQDYCSILMELHKLCLLLPNVDSECAGYAKIKPTTVPSH